MSKKIYFYIFFIFGLSFFVFGGISLTHASTVYSFGDCRGYWHNTFFIEPPSGYTGCQLGDTSADGWKNEIGIIESFTISGAVKASTDITSYFAEMEKIEKMDINDLDVSDVENMTKAFYKVGYSGSGIAELDLSKWNTSNVKSMQDMFSMSNIKSLILSGGFDTSNVTNFDGMFSFSKFEKLKLNFNTTRAENMENMFSNAEYLKELDLSNFTMSGSSLNCNSMFKNVGTKVKEGTTIKLNNTFADESCDLNLPGSGYHVDCDEQDDYVLTSELSSKLSNCSGAIKLTPAYVVNFDYNGGLFNSLSGSRLLFLNGTHIDTASITPTKSGHKFIEWTDTQDPLNANIKISLGGKSVDTYGNYYVDNVDLYAQWKEYKIISGNNPTHIIGSNTGMIIETNGNFDHLKEVFLGTGLLDPNDYEVLPSSSGTTLTLKSSYLETLPVGMYTIHITFDDGTDDYEITVNLTIRDKNTGKIRGGSSSVYSKNDTQTGTTSTGNTLEDLSNNDNELLNIDNNLLNNNNNLSNNDIEVNSDGSKKCEIIGDLLFIDLENSFAKCYINYLAKKGIFKGYEDGTIKPENDITRAEFLAIVMRSLEINLDSSTLHNFTDIPTNSNWNKYVNKALEMRIISKNNTKFRPNDPITKEESIKILLLTMGIEISEVELSSYKDVTGWSVKYIEKAREMKLISSENENFRPQDYITRAEVAEIVYNVVSLK